MKKIILTSIALLLLLGFSACGSSKPAGPAGQTKENSYYPVKTPQKIENLKVGTCQELFADMLKNDKKTADNELYRAASVILFSDKRNEEANACCDNIDEEELKKNCKR